MKNIYLVILVLLLVMSTGCTQTAETQKATLVLTNGIIVSVDSLDSEFEAMAVTGDRISALGTVDEVAEWIGPDTDVIDLDGKMVIPGLIEGHGHFASLGSSKMQLDLTKAKNWDEIVDQVAEAVQEANPGDWIVGRGWHQDKWDSVPENAVDGVPTHNSLSAVSPENPVVLRHASGHATFANKMALDLSRISSETPNPAGGEIVRDLVGEPTGLLRETAGRAVGQVQAQADSSMTEEQLEERWRRQIELATEAVLSNGITSFHDAGSSFGTIDRYKLLADENNLNVRLYVMVSGGTNENMDAKLAQYRLVGYGNHFLTVRSIKRWIDGALGAHGAWLLDPYLDMPSSTGLVLTPIEELQELGRIAAKHGFQLNTHAIGDRANREVLNVYGSVFTANPDKTDLRWRIEHAQHIHPDDIPRFAELGVIASMQGVHCTSDGPWVLKRLGPERAESGAYMWRDLWDAGAVVTNGTDVPVEDIDPITSYYSTVARIQADGIRFYPDQALTRIEALRSYTINNAFAAFQENELGSLEIGKLADMVVLSQNLLTVPEPEIPNTKVLYTIVGGKVLWTHPES